MRTSHQYVNISSNWSARFNLVGRPKWGISAANAAARSCMFWTWLVALSFGQAVYYKKLPFGWRMVLGCVGVATLYVEIFLQSGWKSGYLPPLVAVAVIVGLRSRRTLLVMLPVAAFAFWFLSTDAIVTDAYSYSTRLDAWLIVLEMVKVRPIFGFGPANYYWYASLFPIRGYYVPFNSHSQYIDILAQAGLLGLGFFLWFFFEVGRLGCDCEIGCLRGLPGLTSMGPWVAWPEH